MDVNPGFKYIAKFRDNIQGFMIESRDIISSNYFNLKIENGNLVLFNRQSNTFILSIEVI